jgi:DegV family protein with EDD domain
VAVAIVTDTTQYAPPELLAEQQIGVVSLYVNEGGTQARESDLTDVGAFFTRLRDASSLPTTSQPSIGDFLAVYEPLALAGHDIVSVHISADLSGTAEAARQAGEQLMAAHAGRRVEVIDSRSACGGLALIALAGAAAARGGGDIDAVVERVREAQRTTRIWFAIDTLEYLHRGGRVGGAQAWIGGALKIKPILTVDGTITPVERVRTSGRAFERMVSYMDERKADGAGGWAVQHIQAPEQAQRLVERGREVFGTEPALVSEIGPVIGAHVGPGLLGVAGIPPALLQS